MKNILLIGLCLGLSATTFAKEKTPIKVVSKSSEVKVKKNKISIIEDAYVVKDNKNNITLVVKVNF